MPTIRMKTASAGPTGNRSAGQEYEVTQAEGDDLVRGGFAEWVELPRAKPGDVEVATRPEPENAALRVKPITKKRGR